MAKFKVGDRVRIVSSRAFPEFVGMEAVIVQHDINDPWLPWKVYSPSFRLSGGGMLAGPNEVWGCDENFAPLTDPKEEAKRQVRELLDNALKAAEKSKQAVNSRDSIGAPDKVYFANERHV